MLKDNEKYVNIERNQLFGFIYDYNEKNKEYVNDIKALVNNEIVFYEIGQIYKSNDDQIYLDRSSLPENLELHTFDMFEVKKEFDVEKVQKIYKNFTGIEKKINLTKYPISIKQYVEDFILVPIEDKKKFQKENREFLISVRSLKDFKFSQDKYSARTRMKIILLMIAVLEDENLYIKDEENVRQYHTLLKGLPEKFIYQILPYIKNDLYKILQRNYLFYNHDYMADYTVLINNEYVKSNEIKDFIQKRLFLTLSLAYTKENLGKENTPKYYALLGAYTKRIIENINCYEFEIFNNKTEELFDNMKWFEVRKGRYANFGDDDNIEGKHENSIFGSKHFRDTGYLIYNSSEHTSFKLKYKTLSVIHTHCDDGSFTYTYKGQPIFIDPGVSKYMESHPMRKFFRSYEGHSNVFVVGKEKIQAQKLNNEIGKNNHYKVYPKERFEKVKLLEDNWENKNEAKILNNWFEGYDIEQEVKVITENELEFKYNIKADIKDKVGFDFNLDDYFNDARLKEEGNVVKVLGKKYTVTFQFNRKMNVQQRNGYKGYPLGKVVRIKRIRFYGGMNETQEEIVLKVKVTETNKEKIIQKNAIEIVDNKEIDYLYKDNNKNKLVIIFQGAAVPVEDIKHSFEDKEFRENYLSTKETKYSFYKLAEKQNIDADFLYINDSNSYFYGWYLLDKGEFVQEKYNKFISEFIKSKGYDRNKVVTFGSSKGGFASLLYGISNENIGHAISIVPQINLNTHLATSWQKTMYNEYMLNNKKELKNKVRNILYDLDVKHTRVSIFSGQNDSQAKETKEYIDYLGEKSEIDLNAHYLNQGLDHGELLTHYLQDAIDILVKV